MECTLEPLGEPGQFRCAREGCGRVVHAKSTALRADQLHYRCQVGRHETKPKQPRKPPPDVSAEAAKLAEATGDPSIVAMGVHYAAALLRWATAGFPTRTDEEVAAIQAKCQTMPCYNEKRRACGKCGCGLFGRLPITNKARMATEHCPTGKGGW